MPPTHRGDLRFRHPDKKGWGLGSWVVGRALDVWLDILGIPQAGKAQEYSPKRPGGGMTSSRKHYCSNEIMKFYSMQTMTIETGLNMRGAENVNLV